MDLGGWLNRNVFAFGLTSMLGDVCHEMATAVLPQFMRTIGAGAASLGAIEGIADALSSFVKLGAGFHSDKNRPPQSLDRGRLCVDRRGQVHFRLCPGLAADFIGRVLGWFGRGIRGPLRDAMLADSVDQRFRGKAFGFHRAGDTLGAVVGPLMAFWLLGLAADHPDMLKPFAGLFPQFAKAPGPEFRVIFLLTLIPGLLSVASILFLVKEKRRPANHALQFWSTLRAMPRDYRAFLVGVGIFGLADFAPTLMILRATNLLEGSLGIIAASRTAALLYLLRNVVYTAACYPIGALSGRFTRSHYLAVGYGIAVITFLGFAFAPPPWMVGIVLRPGRGFYRLGRYHRGRRGARLHRRIDGRDRFRRTGGGQRGRGPGFQPGRRSVVDGLRCKMGVRLCSDRGPGGRLVDGRRPRCQTITRGRSKKGGVK